MTKKTSPYQVARYGRIASNLRVAMQFQGLTTTTLAEKSGISAAVIYNWLRAVNGPTAANRATVCKILKIPEAELTARAVNANPEPRDKTKTISVLPPRPPGTNVLSFTITSSGDCHLKLDTILPLEQGAPIFRFLLDAGLVRPGDPP